MQRDDWSEQPDGSRIRHENGIRIVDRTTRSRIEHLVTWQDEQAGQVIVMGVDARCRPVYITALPSSV
jgi:hypothetical protein